MGVLIFAMVANAGWSLIQGHLIDSQAYGSCAWLRRFQRAESAMRLVMVELWNRHSFITAIHTQVRWEAGRRHG